LLGKQTLESEIAKEAVKIAAAKKRIEQSPSMTGDDPIRSVCRASQ